MQNFQEHHQVVKYQYKGFSIHFLEKFKEKYLRNNKSTGSKNIRCFPCCFKSDLSLVESHSHYGFCGDAVHVELTYYRLCKLQVSTDSIEDHKLLFIGEFQPCNEEFCALPLKNQIKESMILKRTLDSVSNTKNLHIGEVTNSIQENYCNSQDVNVIITKFTVTLKFVSKPWQYAWIGSRDKADIKHCFVISALQPHDSCYSVEAQFRSSMFEVGSQRRGSGTRNTNLRNNQLKCCSRRKESKTLSGSAIRMHPTIIQIDKDIFNNSNIELPSIPIPGCTIPTSCSFSSVLESIPDILMLDGLLYEDDGDENDEVIQSDEYLHIISDSEELSDP